MTSINWDEYEDAPAELQTQPAAEVSGIDWDQYQDAPDEFQEANQVGVPANEEPVESLDMSIGIPNRIGVPSTKKNEIIQEEESGLSKVVRTAAQIPLGALQSVTWPLDVVQLLSVGSSIAELDDFEERLPRLKKEFPMYDWPEKVNREEWLKNSALLAEYFPTQRNIEGAIERNYGIPLEPKQWWDKLLRLGGMAQAFAPGNWFSRAATPTTGAIARNIRPKLEAGIGAPVASAALQNAGVPEGISDLVGLGGAALLTSGGEAVVQQANSIGPPGINLPRGSGGIPPGGGGPSAGGGGGSGGSSGALPRNRMILEETAAERINAIRQAEEDLIAQSQPKDRYVKLYEPRTTQPKTLQGREVVNIPPKAGRTGLEVEKPIFPANLRDDVRLVFSKEEPQAKIATAERAANEIKAKQNAENKALLESQPAPPPELEPIPSPVKLGEEIGDIFTKERPFENATELGQNATETFRDIDNTVHDAVDVLYEKQRTANALVNYTHPALLNTLTEMEEGLVGYLNPAQVVMRDAIGKIKNMLRTVSPSKDPVTGIALKPKIVYNKVNNLDLMEQSKSLKKHIDFEFAHGDMYNILRPLSEELENAAIQAAERSGNKVAIESSKEAKEGYGFWARNFNNPTARRLRDITNEDFTATGDFLTDIDKFIQVKDVFNKTPAGEKIVGHLQRQIVEEKLQPFLRNPLDADMEKLDIVLKDLKPVISPSEANEIRDVFNRVKSRPAEIKAAEIKLASRYTNLKGETVTKMTRSNSGMKELKEQLNATPEARALYDNLTGHYVEQRLEPFLKNPKKADLGKLDSTLKEMEGVITKEQAREVKELILNAKKSPEFQAKLPEAAAKLEKASERLGIEKEDVQRMLDTNKGTRELKRTLNKTEADVRLTEDLIDQEITSRLRNENVTGESTLQELHDAFRKEKNYGYISEFKGQEVTDAALDELTQLLKTENRNKKIKNIILKTSKWGFIYNLL